MPIASLFCIVVREVSKLKENLHGERTSGVFEHLKQNENKRGPQRFESSPRNGGKKVDLRTNMAARKKLYQLQSVRGNGNAWGRNSSNKSEIEA